MWDLSRFFVPRGWTTDAPDTVNPSLWRQSQLVVQGGLYKVVDRLYQVRSADLSNLTIVEGDTGLIVFDPLISVETASVAMDLYFQHPREARRSPSCTRTATPACTTGPCGATTVERTRAAFDKGEYRWVAEVVNHVVFADPTTRRPRICRPMRWSSSATRRRRARGATSISPAPRSCARASRSCRRRTPRAQTPCGR